MKEVLGVRTIYFMAVIGALLQLPAIADQYDSVNEVHHTNFARKFPGKGTIDDWHRGQQRSLAAEKASKAKDYENAISMAEEAIKIYPYEADFYNQLGCVLWQRRKPGDFDRGIENVRKAVEISPDTCYLWDNLAKGLASVDKLQEARDALVHASKCVTTPEKLAEIEGNIGIIDQALAKQKTDHAK